MLAPLGRLASALLVAVCRQCPVLTSRSAPLPHPAQLITVMAFFMASAIFTVYGFTMDTLFFDFVEDEERARNSNGDYAPYAPSALRSAGMQKTSAK